MMVIDKEIIKKRFGRSMGTYNQHAIVQKRICKEMIRCLQENTNTSFSNLFEVGCGSGLLTAEIIRYMPPQHYFVNDLVPAKETEIERVFDRQHYTSFRFLEGDAEKITFPGTLDGIISTSTVQWFNKLSSFFDKVHNSLTVDGIFAFSTFGPENFKEIKTVLNHGLYYPDTSELLDMLSKNFDILCIRDYRDTLSFQSPIDVLKHIRYTGVNGIKSFCWSRKDLFEFEERYFERNKHHEKDGVVLTYHPIIILAKKR